MHYAQHMLLKRYPTLAGFADSTDGGGLSTKCIWTVHVHFVDAPHDIDMMLQRICKGNHERFIEYFSVTKTQILHLWDLSLYQILSSNNNVDMSTNTHSYRLNRYWQTITMTWLSQKSFIRYAGYGITGSAGRALFTIIYIYDLIPINHTVPLPRYSMTKEAFGATLRPLTMYTMKCIYMILPS